MNEKLRLIAEVEQLERELQTHLQTHKQRMEETDFSLNTLLRQKSVDEAAITGLVANIQELRGEKASMECRLVDLEREQEDSGKDLSAAALRNDSLVSGCRCVWSQLEEELF